jgi:uncharacterized protein
MKIDCHVHLIGVSERSGCYVSPRMKKSPSFVYLKRKFGLHKISSPETQEQVYLDRLVSYVEGSELDRAVLLALDAVHDGGGQADWGRTQTYVSNDYVHSACKRYPEHFLFGASVHPQRKDALAELERVRENGAVLVKLLPNSQGFDPADEKLVPYWRKMSDLGLVLLIHAGFEHTITPIDQSLGNPDLLKPVLDTGLTVVVAHGGTAGMMHLRETFGSFLALCKAYPNCFGDNSALTNLWRSKYLRDLLDPGRIMRKYGVELENPLERFIHGSDFPIPITPWVFVDQLSATDRRKLRPISSPLQKDIALKRALGVPDECLTRGNDLFSVVHAG